MTRKLLLNALLSLLLISTNVYADAPSSAQPYQTENTVYHGKFTQDADKPTFVSVAADAVLARPALLALTALGAGLFVVTLPFSALSNSVPQAQKTLINEPAKATFQRCLGCPYQENNNTSAKK